MSEKQSKQKVILRIARKYPHASPALNLQCERPMRMKGKQSQHTFYVSTRQCTTSTLSHFISLCIQTYEERARGRENVIVFTLTMKLKLYTSLPKSDTCDVRPMRASVWVPKNILNVICAQHYTRFSHIYSLAVGLT